MFLIPGILFSPAGLVQAKEMNVARIRLTSSAFQDGEDIPVECTCKGGNSSPPLSWKGAPKETESFVLIMDNPRSVSEIIDHWVMYNIPPSTRQLPSGIPPQRTLSDDSLQGTNHFREVGYTGPCPPPGKRYLYHFHLYALDQMLYPTLPLPNTVDRSALLDIIQGHVLAYGELSGYVGG